MKKYIIALLLLCCMQGRPIAQRNKGINEGEKQAGIFHTDIPEQTYNIILSRPTDHSITLSILANENLEGYIAYGINADKLVNKTSQVSFIKGQTTALEIVHLVANKSYYYQFVFTPEHSKMQTTSPLNRFQTQRSPKTSFTFTVQADSHLDENAGTDMYLKTLSNMAADSADFLIDLGDTWMTDKYHPDYKESLKQYIAQRYYFGSLCKSSSLFLTLGNHDGESGQELKKRNDDNMTEWATDTRKKYYFNPFPNGFYSGNDARDNNLKDVENYYAWEWGNALFVVLDPFRFSTASKEPWQRTLGLRQYSWLKSTLEKSKASFKFVFIHNLVGGVDLKGRARGGSEAAKYYEWGGLDSSGVNHFAENRPGWEKPIHDLLVTNNVNILFHGHDHFFAKQDRDGLVYQLVPQPGALRYGNTNSAAEYGYTEGKILNGPGYMRIKIEDKKATVELVQTSIDAAHKNKEILFTYNLKAE
jgi:hypothetical protein